MTVGCFCRGGISRVLAWAWELQAAIDSRAQNLHRHCWSAERVKQRHWNAFKRRACLPRIPQICRQASCRPRRIVVPRAGLGASEGMGDESGECTTCRRLNCRHGSQSQAPLPTSTSLRSPGAAKIYWDSSWRRWRRTQELATERSMDDARVSPILARRRHVVIRG
jgi:hypothetical protein